MKYLYILGLVYSQFIDISKAQNFVNNYLFCLQVRALLRQNELRNLIIEHQQIVNNIQKIELFSKRF